MKEFFMSKNKTAVITGSARGIGKEIGRIFAERGFNVIISDLSQKNCEDTADELKSATGSPVLGKACDVRSKEQNKSLGEFALDQFGSLDIWVNNAGVVEDDLLIRLSEEKWDLVQDVCLKGAFLGTQTAAKIMLKTKKGRIINIGSVSGFYGNGGQSNYSSAKAGLIALTKSSARELASRNITVNCVAAGFIANGFASNLSEEIRNSILNTIPLKIDRNPEEAVASAVYFLASDEADWITGTTLRVDGGMMIGF
ncbi:KR domain protein [Leptospira broomii serovar Hurstbridge str. 5399]|uniref:KR domain protein n=2 Tax=Leptospira broomii TaxID=301541 RepID=T0F118_9LEPT|nr:KR domain protein [Leptospira broomii serovar Hurstbridge str. 5399]